MSQFAIETGDALVGKEKGSMKYLIAIALGLSAACYDASKVPPCSPYASWPDPCYDVPVPVDAGGE